jgi:hypothetical protein
MPRLKYIMNTRSKSQGRTNVEVQLTNQLEVNIDFDDASKEWHKNKKSIGNSQYKYICTIVRNNKDEICNKVCYKNNETCWIHRNFLTHLTNSHTKIIS